MNELISQCIDCGTGILQRTADRRNGRCVKCDCAAAASVPDDYQVPHDIAQLLVSVGRCPEDYRAMSWQHGPDSVCRIVDRIQEEKVLVGEWAPRMMEYAEICRQKNPLPSKDLLTVREREMQRVYELSFAKTCMGYEGLVAICSMPLIAIQVAQCIWPITETGPALLTPDETAHWHVTHPQPSDATRWFVEYWWTIEDSPDHDRFEWSADEIPPGEQLWLVTEGHVIDPHGGWGQTGLWTWNGERSRFVRQTSRWIS